MATRTQEPRARNAAIERGLDFVYRAGNKQKHFANYGAFMICCFALVGATARDERLRRIGRDRAKQLRPALEPNASGVARRCQF